MPSSTTASERVGVALLALLLAVIPPAVGFAALAPARPGSALPAPPMQSPLRLDRRAELVFVGNSKVASDIDLPTLRAALGRPEMRVEVVSIGSATMPVYYALLRNVVLPRTSPRAVVVYATPVEILTSDLTADRRERLLRPYLVDDEPVIARKLYDHAPGGLLGVRERAVAARDGTLSLVAAGVAGVVTGEPGRSALDAAFDTVFGQTWATRARPGAQTVPMGGFPSESAIGQVLEDTFVLETEALFREAGVPLVYAVAPVTGEVAARERRRLRGMDLVLAKAATHADAWIDLPHPGEDASRWRDDEHMSKAAAVENTRALARELVRRGLVGVETAER